MTNKKMNGGKKHKKRGGQAGASGYGSYIWGPGEQQHSISPDTNVIAPVNDPTKFTGGNEQLVQNPNVGGGVLTSVGVPALLIAANQLYNPKKRLSKNKSKRSMRKFMGGSETDPDAMLANAQKMMSNINPTIPSVVYTSNLNPAPLPENVPKLNGGASNNDGSSKFGAGILTNIAVPAVLMTANQMYKRKSRKNTYKNKRSRKFSSKRRYKR